MPQVGQLILNSTEAFGLLEELVSDKFIKQVTNRCPYYSMFTRITTG